jgi:hypothetical protein
VRIRQWGRKATPTRFDITSLITDPGPDAAFQDNEGLIFKVMDVQRRREWLRGSVVHRGELTSCGGRVEEHTHDRLAEPQEPFVLAGLCEERTGLEPGLTPHMVDTELGHLLPHFDISRSAGLGQRGLQRLIWHEAVEVVIALNRTPTGITVCASHLKATTARTSLANSICSRPFGSSTQHPGLPCHQAR